MNKTTKIILACIAGTMVFCCGGGIFMVMGGVKAYQALGAEVVKPGDEAVSAICSNWDVDALVSRSGPEVLKTPKVELEGMFKIWKSEYGSFKTGSSSMTAFNSSADISSGKNTRATYENKATFEKGDATVYIVFSRRDSDPWKIDSFKVVKR